MKFLAIGDSCTDKYVYGKCERLCPEAPVAVLNPMNVVEVGGMAKNVQANVRALGVSCDVVTNTDEILKTRYVDHKTNQMILRVDEDDYTEQEFNPKDVNWSDYDAVIVSDYGKGFLEKGAIRKICLEHDNVFFNTKRKLLVDIPRNIRFLQLNQYELDLNPGLGLTLRQSTPHYEQEKVIVTLGEKGCLYKRKVYPPPETEWFLKQAKDLSGAGDTFLAAFTVSMMRNNNVNKAIFFAQEAACSVVTKRGVATP
jgi:D-beta-D-heptose 7-phosphate kinase/D-beta-D-heptose 1-phosphate adenosyltransferase